MVVEKTALEELRLAEIESVLSKDEAYIECAKRCVHVFDKLKSCLGKDQIGLLFEYEDVSSQREIIEIRAILNCL